MKSEVNKYWSQRLFAMGLISLVLILVSPAYAQNMQIIGGNSLAQACYQGSTSAALTGNGSHAALQSCDDAIAKVKLKRRDLIATYVNRGVINVAMENFQAAAKDYNRAIELDPDVAEAYLNRGNLWFIAHRYSEAIADYDHALKLGFAQPYVALLNRGMVRETVGQLKMAQADYTAALKEREEWTIAIQKLARVTQKLDVIEQAGDGQKEEKR
jgi:tetratricopeptide (TPR) repeat protein